MNSFIPAFIVGALLVSGPAWASGPQGKGQDKHAKATAKHEQKEMKEDLKDVKKDAKNMRFSGLDLNGDHMITRNEWRGNDTSFRVHDWNRDNVLSGDELRLDAHKPDRFYRKDWRGDLREFDKADTNHDGVLTAEEFARWR